jgi:hypothetical protein
MNWDLVITAVAGGIAGYWLGYYRAQSEQPYAHLGRKIAEAVDKEGKAHVDVHFCGPISSGDDDDDGFGDDMTPRSPANKWVDN